MEYSSFPFNFGSTAWCKLHCECKQSTSTSTVTFHSYFAIDMHVNSPSAPMVAKPLRGLCYVGDYTTLSKHTLLHVTHRTMQLVHSVILGVN